MLDDVGVDERVVVLVVVDAADSDEYTVCVDVAIELGVKPSEGV